MTVRFRLLLIVFAPILVGGGVFLMGLRVIYDDHRLNTNGVTVPIVSIVNGTVGNGDEVHFRSADGEELSESMVVPMDVRAKLVRHETVTIDYLPADHKVNRFTGEKRALYSMTAIGFALLLLGLWLLGKLMSK